MFPKNILKRFTSSTTWSRMGFTFWPKFFSPQEQRVLLAAALFKLDATDDIQTRRRRRIWAKNLAESPIMTPGLFYPDELYDFQEGHYDQVIRKYREMHLAGWPTADFDGLTGVLHRLHSLCPTSNTQTHLLHLASDGEILPHIDNISASGSWIMGVSLGAERLLRLESIDKTDSFEVLLTPGSVYLQRDDIRYLYRHSIAQLPRKGQRLSIMIRDHPSDLNSRA